jgi:hypothetical protein
MHDFGKRGVAVGVEVSSLLNKLWDALAFDSWGIIEGTRGVGWGEVAKIPRGVNVSVTPLYSPTLQDINPEKSPQCWKAILVKWHGIYGIFFEGRGLGLGYAVCRKFSSVHEGILSCNSGCSICFRAHVRHPRVPSTCAITTPLRAQEKISLSPNPPREFLLYKVFINSHFSASLNLGD